MEMVMDTPLVVRDALKTELLSVLMIRYKKIKKMFKKILQILLCQCWV